MPHSMCDPQPTTCCRIGTYEHIHTLLSDISPHIFQLYIIPGHIIQPIHHDIHVPAFLPFTSLDHNHILNCQPFVTVCTSRTAKHNSQHAFPYNKHLQSAVPASSKSMVLSFQHLVYCSREDLMRNSQQFASTPDSCNARGVQNQLSLRNPQKRAVTLITSSPLYFTALILI